MSNYSTIYLPWGPLWTAAKVRKAVLKKDKLINKCGVSSMKYIA